MNKPLIESLQAKGHVYLEFWDVDNNLIEKRDFSNLIVNTGKQSLARLLGQGDLNRRVKSIAFGTGGAPAEAGNTTLGAGILTKLINSKSYSGNTVSFNFSLELNEGNGQSIREFGLITEGGHLFSRVVRDAINKTSDFRITGVWNITF